MEKQHGRESELAQVKHELAESNALVRKLGQIIKAKDEEIRKLRELIVKRGRFLPAMPEGRA